MADKDIGKILDAFLQSVEKVNRLAGVTAVGAVDHLPRVLAELENEKYADVRDHSIFVLRHWLGREKGHTLQLIKTLVKDKNDSKIQALSVIQLGFSIDEKARSNPNTHELLIYYLDHRKITIREPANWHLVRPVPEGKTLSIMPLVRRRRGKRQSLSGGR